MAFNEKIDPLRFSNDLQSHPGTAGSRAHCKMAGNSRRYLKTFTKHRENGILGTAYYEQKERQERVMTQKRIRDYGIMPGRIKTERGII